MAYTESLPTLSVRAMIANLAVDRMSDLANFGQAVRRVLKEPEALKEAIMLLDRAAGILLEADDRGDPLVFGNSYGPVTFSNVVASYGGSPSDQTADAERMLEIAHQCARNLPASDQDACVQKVLNGFRDYFLGDAAAVCLLRNQGSSGDIPAEALQVLIQHGRYGPEKSLVNIFAPGYEVDAVRWYRKLQSHLFSRAMLIVFHQGNMHRVERDLPSIEQNVLIYQLATDLLHEKNPYEPTYEVVRAQLGLTNHQFALDEARSMITGPIRQRMIGVAAFVASGVLCRLSGRHAEWEQPRD